MQIAVLPQSESEVANGRILAERIGAQFIEKACYGQASWKQLANEFKNDAVQALLLVGKPGLSLLPLLEGYVFSPLFMDFNSAAWQRRLKQLSARKELVPRSLGLHNEVKTKRILDTNAGLGVDSFVLAALGARVTAVERSPLVYELLNDALQRARSTMNLLPVVERIELKLEDSIRVLPTWPSNVFDAVYMDPMFPEKRHKAASKKEMQIFQALLGHDQDAQALLSAALTYMNGSSVCKRVVLKRPLQSSVWLAERLGRQEKGNTARCDIYFRQSP